MRWLTLLLIVINLGVFAYFQQQEQTQRLRDRYVNKLPAVPEWQLLTESATEVTLAALPESGLEPELEKTDVDEAPVVEAPGAAPVADAVEVVAVPEVAVSAEQGDTLDPVESPAVERGCYRWGEFDRRREAKAVLARLQPLESRVEARRVALPPEYWVYIKAPSKATERNQLSRYLSDMGLDNYWIQSGHLKGDLSMGLYRNQGSAEALRSLLQDRGFAAEIYLKPRYFNRYSIDFVTESSAEQVAEIAASLRKKSPQLKTEKKVCQGVASADQPE